MFRSRTATLVLAATTAALAAATLTAYATTSNSAVYYACLKSGTLSSVTLNQQPTSCSKGSTIVSWNAQGTQGLSVTAAPASNSSSCGNVGGYTLTQTDPGTGATTSVGDLCNGAAGATGATGPAGPPGPTLSSLDDLSGVPCNNGTGTTLVSYSGTAVSIACQPPPVTLTVTTSGTGTGTITSSPSGIDCGSGGETCSMQVEPGTKVTLSVAADAGSAWSSLSANCQQSYAGATCSLTVSDATTVDFGFTAGRVLSVYSSGGGFTSDPGGINCQWDLGGTGIGSLGCQAAFADGKQVTLTFHKGIDKPAGQPDWAWGAPGCSGPASTPCTIVMDANYNVGVG